MMQGRLLATSKDHVCVVNVTLKVEKLRCIRLTARQQYSITRKKYAGNIKIRVKITQYLSNFISGLIVIFTVAPPYY